ncbi:hypothetical protein [Flavihumibacter petaseus]|uniref:Bacteriocin n=1 Tax=Flavihumibacter petaseus NBRC 106054 TaxID=1220578 RepID=A0A0E9MU42_9BACT|nr:hypothetical protein [Flavihumibacter petaseus]GAO41292.1 hypothetical protein FPE01S_01_03040 [Flavihumibacter petaseus NBRC 106054]
MKNHEAMETLSIEEMTRISGGSAGEGTLAGELAQLGAKALQSLWELGKMVSDTQSSIAKK